jgi:hypothetical protein
MLRLEIVRRVLTISTTLAIVLAASGVVHAQNTTIGVGQPGPVVAQQGLLGEYYNNPGTTGSPPAPPGSPILPTSTTAVLQNVQIDGPVDTTFGALPTGLSGDHFMAAWTGFVVITTAGDYLFGFASDDGGRLWVNQNPLTTTVSTTNTNTWIDRGNSQDLTPTFAGLTVGQKIPIRVEMYENAGNQDAHLRWSPTNDPLVVVPIPKANLLPPDGPNPPINVVVTSPTAPPPATINVSWSPAGSGVTATQWIVSRWDTTANAAPTYVQVAVQAGTSFIDSDPALIYGHTYSYLIQGTARPALNSTPNQHLLIGNPCPAATVTPILPAITVFPNSGLQTNENGASTVSTITFNQALPMGQTVTFTFTSNNSTEGIVSSSGAGPLPSITFDINGPQAIGKTFDLTIIGVDDPIVDGPQPYKIQCSTSGFFGAVTIPDLNCTNNDNDTPGITFSRTSGLLTSESGAGSTFTVVLNTQPTANVTMSLASTNTLEGIVSPASLTFTTTGAQSYSTSTGIGGWNVGHDVVVTGVDDSVLDFTVAYTITTGALVSTDPGYNGMAAPDVACANLDNEVPPTLPTVWGNGGCGLMGTEFALPLLLAAMLRRRRSR